MTAGDRPEGRKIIALCGGVGGAKLAYGLSRILPPEDLTVVVNTGDDFSHLGVWVSPDIDTVLYTLSDSVNPEHGWGRKDESWRFMEALRALGGPDWFAMGDTDLATCALRAQRLHEGARLTEITGEIARGLGVECRVIPASDDPMPTIVETDAGALAFQHYFVRDRWQPKITALDLSAAERAVLTPELRAALEDPALGGVVLCPSNPYLSIDPMLSIPGLRGLLQGLSVPVVAVAPLVGGAAVKGPLSKMMDELHLPVGLQTIADHYGDFLDLLLIDESDAEEPVEGVATLAAPTLMKTNEDRIALARIVLAALDEVEG